MPAPVARQRRQRKPRRWTTLIVTCVLLGAVGAVYVRSEVLGGSSNGLAGGVHVPGTDVVIGGSTPLSKGDAGDIQKVWPPVPPDASPNPLGTPPAKASASREFAFIGTISGADGKRPVAWDPCRPIHLVVNDAHAPTDSDKLLREATARVSSATGLQFVFDGATTEAPSADRSPQDKDRYGDKWSPVLVAWTDPGTVQQLAGSVAGLAGPDGAPFYDAEQRHWVSGSVNLDGPQLSGIIQRPAGWDTARAIVMHELGHLVGLKHAPESSELMYANSTRQTDFGPGDREGLRQLGLGRCFTS